MLWSILSMSIAISSAQDPLPKMSNSPANPLPQSIQSIANGVELFTGTTHVRVQFTADGIVHVVKWLPGSQPKGESLIVIPRSLPKLDIIRTERPEACLLSSKRLQVRIVRKSGEIHFGDALGVPVLGEKGEAAITPVQIEFETRAFSVRQAFQLSPEEGIYGLGQHQAGEMNYRNRTVKLVQANTQSAIPFLVSTRGYGILWDNYSKTIFVDSPDGASLWSEVADDVDYHFVYGGNIDGAIAGYRELTGAAPLYGKWAYGYWQSKEHYENREELLRVAAEYRTRQIPIDGIIQDWDTWEGRENWNQLFFDPKKFPEPAEMIELLHQQNYHFMVSIWCGFGPNTLVYQDMEKRGFLYPPVGWAGFKFFDAYNPDAARLYWEYVKAGFFSKGVDGWWMDSTEPDIVNAQTKESQEYEMKRTGTNHLGSFARYLNTYPLLSTESVYANQRRETSAKRVYILTRSVFAGQQRAAATTWTGDIGASWEVYRKQISAGLNHGMSGVPYWTFDIGAFVLGSYGGVFADGGKDPAYQELYTRMFQLGTFSPIFRSHGSETPREIWEFGPFSDVLVKFDRLRYRLMPYIYSLGWKVTSEGSTIMRGLPMDFPSDRKTFSIDDQFMFGPALMVSPVTEYMLHRPPEKTIPVTGDHFKTKEGKPGLDVTYFDDDAFGTPVCRRLEPTIDLNWYTGWPSFITQPKFSMRWEGILVPTETGLHRFHIKSFGPRHLLLDGKELALNYQSTEAYTVPIELLAGREYAITFETANSVLGAFRAQLFWKTPSILAKEKIAEARAQTRPVYLPVGTGWVDFWSGRSVAGGQNITADAPIDKIPLFVRAGSIIPMGPFIQYAAEKPADPIELRIYPGADGEFVLYEDENDNYNYEKGIHATIAFHWDDGNRQLRVFGRNGSYPGMPPQRRFEVVIVGPDHGVGIEVTPKADRTAQYSGEEQLIQF
jgi:alpha-D-xyloside xylohydrolase